MNFEAYGISIETIDFNSDGNGYHTCPKCSATRTKKDQKCLRVNVERGELFCNHCGWGRHDGQSSILTDMPDDVPTFEQDWESDIPDSLMEYFTGRGISRQTLIANRIGARGNLTVAYPRFYPDGSIVGVQFRELPKTFSQKHDSYPCFWGYHNVFENGSPICRTLYITEGVEDALSLWEAGFFWVLSLPHGAGSTKAVDDFCFQALLQDVDRVVLALDQDTVGRKAQEELARRIGYHKCYKALFPDDCKDANGVLTKHGIDALRRAINDAQIYPVEGLFTIRNEKQELLSIFRGGVDPGRTTGLDNLDGIFKWRDASLITMIAVPKAGKSRLANQLMINQAKIHGTKIAFYAPESLPIHYHTSKLISAYTGKRFNDLTLDEFDQAVRFVEEHFTWMVPNETDIESLLDLCKATMHSKGSSIFVFDPFNYINVGGETEHSDIGKVLAKQVAFTRQTNSIILNIVHPKKMEKSKSKDDTQRGEFPILDAYDTSGSAHFANRSDIFLSLWRSQRGNHPVQLHCILSKFEEVAKMGESVLLAYDHPTSQFLPYYGSTTDELPTNILGNGDDYEN